MATNQLKKKHQRTAPEVFPDILTTDEAARFLRCSTQRLEIWRSQGGGPPFAKLGRMVRYRLDDLKAWTAAHVISNTGQTPRATI